MQTSKSKWLAYTVLVGLIPILTRFLVWITTKGGVVENFVPADFIAFGLVLHISIINEIEHLSKPKDREWKSIQNGTSVIFIALYSALYSLILIGERNKDLIDNTVLLHSAVSLSFISLILSLAIFHRISNSEARVEE